MAMSLPDRLVKSLSERGETVSAAESFTAGLAADLIVQVPGASRVFWGSFVCYSVEAKHKMLGIPEALIREQGPVSRPVAIAMAEGALEKSGAAWAFSITGFAGPEGDEVGTVWIGIARRDKSGLIVSQAQSHFFKGSRNEIREAAAQAAIKQLVEQLLALLT